MSRWGAACRGRRATPAVAVKSGVGRVGGNWGVMVSVTISFCAPGLSFPAIVAQG